MKTAFGVIPRAVFFAFCQIMCNFFDKKCMSFNKNVYLCKVLIKIICERYLFF